MVHPLKFYVAKINRRLGGNMEQRACARFAYRCPVDVENRRTGRQSAGNLANYNRLGLYFECDDAHAPGSEIDVRFDESVVITSAEPLKAEVRWCKTIGEAKTGCRYGIGARYRPHHYKQSAANGS
jgi:hypothetical protein